MARYKDAIRWIALNDDCEWLEGKDGSSISVTAALVADLFRKTDYEVAADLRGECNRQREARFRFRNQG